MAGNKKLKYLGGGFLPGVPSRDLSSEEANRFGVERLIASGLYEDNYPAPQEDEPLTYEEDVEVIGGELDKIESTFEED